MSLTTRSGPKPQASASLAGVRLRTAARGHTVELRGRSKFCSDLDAVLAELVRLSGGAS